MKKLVKMFMVISIALTLATGVASAEWLQCTPTEVLVMGDGSVQIKVTGAGCEGFKDGDSDFKWIVADDPGAERALAVTLTAITLGKKITFNVSDKNGYLPSVSALGLK